MTARIQVFSFVTAALLTISAPLREVAAQCLTSVPMGHELGTHCEVTMPAPPYFTCHDNTNLYWTGLPEQYLSGRYFLFKTPSVNSGSQVFFATEAGLGGRLDCREAGTSTDGILCVKGD